MSSISVPCSASAMIISGDELQMRSRAGRIITRSDEAAQKRFEPKHRLIRVRCAFSVRFVDAINLLFPRRLVLLRRRTRPLANSARSVRTGQRRFVTIVHSHTSNQPYSRRAHLLIAVPRHKENQGQRGRQEGQINRSPSGFLFLPLCLSAFGCCIYRSSFHTICVCNLMLTISHHSWM